MTATAPRQFPQPPIRIRQPGCRCRPSIHIPAPPSSATATAVSTLRPWHLAGLSRLLPPICPEIGRPGKSLAPPPQPVLDPAFYADANTPPILARDGDTLYLFVRGRDDNLYETHKASSGDWSNWQPLTADGRLRGRLSVTFTRAKGVFNSHVIYTSANNTVEYRRFAADWTQTGPIEQWTNALEGVIATDGKNEVWAAIMTTNRRLLIEKKNRPWFTPWNPVTSKLADGEQGEFLDISNLVFFDGAYHAAYTVKYLCDDVTNTYCYALAHTRIRAGLPDDGYVRWIEDYTPQGNNHPQAALIVYRNKLVMAYKDSQEWVRYTRWDNADPTTPWSPVPGDIVGLGLTDQRPALATFDTGLPSGNVSRGMIRASANEFGNDLLAAVNGSGSDRLWFVNFSRVILKQYMNQIGIEANYVLDDPPPTAAVFDNQLYLFLRDRGRNFRFKTSSDGNTWSSTWNNLTGYNSKPISPGAVTFGGKLYLFIARWNERGVRMRSFDGTSWSGWSTLPALPDNRSASQGPTTAVLGNKLHLFVLASNGRIHTTTTTDGVNWTNWVELPPPPDSCQTTPRPCFRHDPAGKTASVQAFGGRLYLFTRLIEATTVNPNKTEIWSLVSSTDGSWTNTTWRNTNIFSPSDPAALVFGSNLYLFARDRWNQVQVNQAALDGSAPDGIAWSGWSMISGTLTPTGPAAAVLGNKMVLFVRGMDYKIWHTTSTSDAAWSGWTEGPGDGPVLYGPFTDNVENLPGFTEAGYAFWSLPDWIMGHIFQDYQASIWQYAPDSHPECTAELFMRVGKHVSDKYAQLANANRYPIWLEFNGSPRIWCGDHINYRNDYTGGIWDEIGHTVAGALRIYDSSPPPWPWTLEPGIGQGPTNDAMTLFSAACSSQKDGSGRPRGAIAKGCDSVQHRWMYPLIEYFSNGDQLRKWIADDLACTTCTPTEQNLLQQKYDWYKQYIFRGVEFRTDNEPLVPLVNDNFTTTTMISSTLFEWTAETTAATSDIADPVISCGNQQYGRSVWFRYVPPEDGKITVSTVGSSYDTVLAAWTGQWGSLAAVACNDNVGENDTTSRMTVDVSAGVPIYFEVAAYNESASSQLEFRLMFSQATVYLPLVQKSN